MQRSLGSPLYTCAHLYIHSNIMKCVCKMLHNLVNKLGAPSLDWLKTPQNSEMAGEGMTILPPRGYLGMFRDGDMGALLASDG